MQKILFLSNTSFSIEKFRSHYINKISKNAEVITCTPFSKPKNLNKKINHFKLKGFFFLLELYNFIKIINREKPNLLVVYSFKYQFLCSLIFNKKIYNKIYVIAGRGSTFLIKNFFIKNILLKVINFTLNSSDKLIFINPYDKEFFEKYFSLNKNNYLLPTEGLEVLKRRKKSFNSKKNFIFFARLINSKGIYEYIAAAKILKKKYSHLNFYIAGPLTKNRVGQSYLFYKKNQKILSLIKNTKEVKYLGYIENYKKIFHKIDCLISPSYTEGAGTSVMEAMMSGLFVIAYNNSGHKFVLKNTKNLICNKNTVNEITKNVEKYLKMNSNELKKNYKSSYLKITNNFSDEVIFNQIKKIPEFQFDRKLLTVVIPSYNRISLLSKKLIEIKKINYSFIDFLIILEKKDNQSVSFVKKFLNRHNLNHKVNILIQSSNNPDMAIRSGISASKQNYILINGDDDNLDLDNLRYLIKPIQKNYDIIFSKSFYFTKTNKKKIKFRLLSSYIKFFFTAKFGLNAIKYFNYIMTTSTIINKKFIKKIRGYPVNKNFISDYHMWMKFSKLKNKSTFVNSVTTYTNYDKDTLTGKNISKSDSYSNIFKMISDEQNIAVKTIQLFLLYIKKMNDRYLKL